MSSPFLTLFGIVNLLYLGDMGNRGLLFIPDISGFTQFVNETDLEHSRLIIQELLEILVDANTMGLEVSEVEGDAILFYKFGAPPGLGELSAQVEKMFTSFHKNLAAYNLRKYCQCKACLAAVNLTLKVITHYGEFSTYNVKNFKKLIGRDVIVAHQLLKNSIDNHEYWMVTSPLSGGDQLSPITSWMEWSRSSKATDSGEIGFQYTPLGQLRHTIVPDSTTPAPLADKSKVLSVSREFETDIITLFHATGDFNYRPRWCEGVVKVEEVGHFLPRIGMRCRCVYENGEVITYSNSYQYHPEKIEFSEAEEKRHDLTYYTLEKTSGSKTRLTIDFYISQNFFNRKAFHLFRKKLLTAKWQRSLNNLSELVKGIPQPPRSKKVPQ